MTKKKKDKGTSDDLHRKLMNEQDVPQKNRGEFVCSRRVSSSFFTSSTRRVALVTNMVISLYTHTLISQCTACINISLVYDMC